MYNEQIKQIYGNLVYYMKILYYNNGSGLGTAKSGGTARHIETAKVLQNKNVEVNIVTTKGAIALYNAEDLVVNDLTEVRSSINANVEKNPYQRALGYVISTIHSLLLTPKLCHVDFVYSVSDYFCDVLPTIAYKIINPKTICVVMIHHMCKSPLKRKGNFLLNTASFIFQRINYLLVKIFADLVLLYDTSEGRAISMYIYGSEKSPKVKYVYNGIDVKAISKIKKPSKYKYDACFAGGLRVTKGIYDLIPIWKNVTEKYPNAVIAVAGEGTATVTQDLLSNIKANGLEQNIVLLGALKSDALYKLLKSSKVFVSSSHEEGWGIAVCEALACSTPVVAYDLPAFGFLKNTISKVPRYDSLKFSKEIIKLLDSREYAIEKGIKGSKFVERFDWYNIGISEYTILQNALKINVKH